MGVLKHFNPPGTCFVLGVSKHFDPPWDIFWSGGIQTFFSLEHVLVWGYWNILLLGVFYKDFQLYQVFLLNCFKHFVYKSNKKIHTQFSVPKCFIAPIWYTTDTDFYNLSVKMVSISFFSFSDTQKFYHLSESFFKCFAFLKFDILDKKAVLIRLKIKTICLTKKLFKNSHWSNCFFN